MNVSFIGRNDFNSEISHLNLSNWTVYPMYLAISLIEILIRTIVAAMICLLDSAFKLFMNHFLRDHFLRWMERKYIRRRRKFQIKSG